MEAITWSFTDKRYNDYFRDTKKEIKMMKKTSFLINTSRGPIINENDLVEALKDENLDDQKRFLANQKIDVLNRLN